MDNTSSSFIKINRSIFDHWIFKEAEKFKSFIDLIQLMKISDEEILVGNEILIVPKGSYYTSVLTLSTRWNWSRDKTRTFLNLLENEGILKVNSTTKGTMLTIVNYSFYEYEPPRDYTTKPQQLIDESSKKIPKQKKDNDTIINAYTENQELKNSIAEFIKMRKNIKKPLTDKALTLILNKLDKLSCNDKEKVEILNQSIMNCWQGVFELKKPYGKENFNGYNGKTAQTGKADSYDFSKF